MLKFLLFSALLLSPLALAKMHCGTDEFQNTVAYNYMSLYCPQYYDHANNCCFQHDSCYATRAGRQKCDDAFCDCLRGKMSDGFCRMVADQACGLVQIFGQPAYDKPQA
uniref:Phospholipase A2 n=1 Tax=Steinernema glaseri TaxID=37863 RepID=A0A1I7ZSI6_9BILA